MDIKQVDYLSEAWEQHLFHWREIVFPVEGELLDWTDTRYHILAFDQPNTMPIAHIGYDQFRVYIDNDQALNVIGVGSVVVRPEFQGQHILNSLFPVLYHSDHAKSLADAFTLFCPERLTTYYARHGYQRYKGDVSFLQKQQLSGSDDFVFMVNGEPINSSRVHIEGEPW